MRVEEVFTALADPTRRAVIEALAEHDRCTATQLAADMPITRQAIAKHLMHLHRVDLVTSERQGRETYYHLTPRALRQAIGWLEDVCEQATGRRAA